jgi:tRNA-splicing ligase RtcB
MSDRGFVYRETSGAPLKLWTRGVPVEDAAMQQFVNVARLPFIYRHVAAMPDVHWGMGATVGSVIATQGAIVPAAVGVDIGCGMVAARTNLVASDLPDSLAGVRSAIEKAVPHGRTNNGGPGDRGPGERFPTRRRSPSRGAARAMRSTRASRRSPRSTRRSAAPAAARRSTLGRSAPATTSSRCVSTRSRRSG